MSLIKVALNDEINETVEFVEDCDFQYEQYCIALEKSNESK